MSAILATIGFLLDALYVVAARRAAPWIEGEL
jgi:hypothetical protein